MRVLRIFLIFSLLFLLIYSCASGPEDTETDENGGYNLEEYLWEALSYLSSPSEEQFFHFLNTNRKDFRKANARLLKEYATKQKWLIAEAMKQGDYFSAIHHFRNLEAVETISGDDTMLFYNDLIALCRNNGLHATEKYLNIKQGYDERVEYKPLTDIAGFNNLLAEIYIERSYDAGNNLIRKDHPPVFGSGLLIDEHHILTAYHVIEHIFYHNTVSHDIIVNLQGRRMNGVKVVSWDSLTDLAVLKTSGTFTISQPIHTLMGNSDLLKQGFDVYCLGHHEGLTATLTKGIISSPYRKAPEFGSWIQIDAALAPGASGGMLIGKDNLIYGILVTGVMYEDINFVVPSNLILGVLDILIQAKNVKRPWLGLLLDEPHNDTEAVRLDYIFPSSPVKEIDIGMDDELVSINSVAVDSIETAQKIIGERETGNLVKLRIRKSDMKEVDYFVLMTRRPDYAIYNTTRNRDNLETLYPCFGFAVNRDSKKTIHFELKNEKISINFFEVIRIKKETFLDNMGVKAGDFLGIIFDVYENQNRYIQLLHMPAENPFNEDTDITEYIYTMKKSKYDGNIL